MDKLDTIFEMQDTLNQRIGVVTENLSEEEKTKWVLNYTRAMQQEIAELIDSVPWKWWAKYQEFDEQNAKVEIVDLFHFLISLAQVMGMTPDDVYNAYVKKNQVNHNRQESGYRIKTNPILVIFNSIFIKRIYERRSFDDFNLLCDRCLYRKSISVGY